MTQVTRTYFSIAFLLFTFINISGCTVRYVADYDASITEEIVQLAKKVDLFWGALLDTKSSEREYAKFKDQYNRIEADMRGLVMKNEIRALNKESTKQANIALELWIEDRTIHKDTNGFTDFEARRHRQQFNRVFTAMAKGEEVKNTKSSDSGDSKGDAK